MGQHTKLDLGIIRIGKHISVFWDKHLPDQPSEFHTNGDILQVHDELLVETAEEEKEQVSAILEKEMKNAASLAVSLEIDMHTGSNWYEAK